MVIRQLVADDWERYREIRLDALRTDPGAFASKYEREAGFDADTWRRRITVGPDGHPLATFVDEPPGGPPLATAAVMFTEHHPAPMLVAMWVRPEARGLGSGRRLVEAAAAWARAAGADRMVLWVVVDNHRAVELYRSCGFRPTGNTDALPSDPEVKEQEMILDLD